MPVYRKWTSNVTFNEHGFAKTESRNIANKIWSIANDLTALLTGRKNAKQITLGMVKQITLGMVKQITLGMVKQITLGMVIHRLTTS